MSLVKQTDVKNHVSLRCRSKIHLCEPVSQPDATGSGAKRTQSRQIHRSLPRILLRNIRPQAPSGRRARL